MRIVGGRLRGRRIRQPRGQTTRPSSERVREAAASALEARGALVGARVLDLYAGTGALSFEALSRGADSAVLVDHSAPTLQRARQCAVELGLGERVRTLKLDLERRPRQAAERIAAHTWAPFDLVFLDPPYARLEHIAVPLQAMVRRGALVSASLVVIEHARRHRPPLRGLELLASYRYGDTELVFARPRPVQPEEP